MYCHFSSRSPPVASLRALTAPTDISRRALLRRTSLDGLSVRRGRVVNHNPGLQGSRVLAHHAGSPCQLSAVPSNQWNASHISYDGGRNDGFVRASGDAAMLFWDKRDRPFTYSL